MLFVNSIGMVSDPFFHFITWYQKAERKGFLRWLLSWLYPQAILHQPESMTLATATPEGKPSARVVLYKGMFEKGFVFYTNYNSRKGLELVQNPQAALVFHWGFPERQIRVEGIVSPLLREESQRYWESRPRGSQLSALASHQSQSIESYDAFLKKVQNIEEKYRGLKIPCPDFWGGYVLRPERFEFWEARLNRMHERVCYEWKNGAWNKYWLAP